MLCFDVKIIIFYSKIVSPFLPLLEGVDLPLSELSSNTRRSWATSSLAVSSRCEGRSSGNVSCRLPLRVSERPRLQRAMAAWLWWWRSPLDSRSGWGSWRCRCLRREWRQMLRCWWKPPLERVRSFQRWPL